MTNFLGIDYGRQYIGLAIATTPLAEPLKTIPTHQAITTIQQIIRDYHVEHLVIGLSEGHMAQETQAFARQISHLTGLPVTYYDETLSSQETRIKIAQAGVKSSRRRQKIDHLVAAAILQDYLDQHQLDG